MLCDVKYNLRYAMQCYHHNSQGGKKIMALSKTQQALRLASQGVPIKAAAQQAGVAESTLRMAIGRTKGKEQCPCCGQVVRQGFEIDSSVLKTQSGKA